MGLMKKKKKTGFLGVGISFLSDKAGSSQLGTNQVNLSLAYHARLSSSNTLSGGIAGGFAQRSIDISKLQWNSQYSDGSYDPNLPSYEAGFSKNKTYSDFGAGLQLTHSSGETYASSNDQLYVNAGVAVFHLNQPNVAFYSSVKDKLPIKLVAHGAFRMGIENTNVSIDPSFIYIQQGTLKDIIAGTLISYKLINESKHTGFRKGSAFSFGGFYRVGDAIIPTVQVEFANYAIGLNYDVNISKLSNASLGRGGLEISLRFINLNPFISGNAGYNKNPLHSGD
jgi:type IX secretion system PorP/SprF family membrane protein